MTREEQIALVARAVATLDPQVVFGSALASQGRFDPPQTTNEWPIDYTRVLAWRKRKIAWLEEKNTAHRIRSLKQFYAREENAVHFINHWVDTHEPRNAGKVLDIVNGVKIFKPVTLPLVLFQRQDEMVQFIMACLDAEAPGLIEKSRDMGATWVALALSVWMWLFWSGSTTGWGTATATKLDRSGDAGSIFEKLKNCIKGLPYFFIPDGLKADRHLLDKRVSNPQNGASIVGEIGAGIGRGSRTRIHFVDEAAHLEFPEQVEAALSETTRVRIDISSVSGLGNVFHRTRQGGREWSPGDTPVHNRTNVLIMDWSHHPAKDQAWHDQKREYWESKGMPHVFESEVERNYSAAVQGTIIPRKWLDACIDAHKAIPGMDDGANLWFAGLDVADSGQDRNALVKRQGWVIRHVEMWAERDTGRTTTRALHACSSTVPCSLEYDSVGVGSGVKAEANRLMDRGLFPKLIRLHAWNGGAKVQNPGDRIVPRDMNSPTNAQFYTNLKAQAWWTLRDRVYKTYRAIKEGAVFDPRELVSIDKDAIGPTMLVKLLEELTQPTASAPRMKLLVDKQPDGTMSPNIGDACVMCCFPLVDRGFTGSAFAAPIIVDGQLNCPACGARGSHDLGRGRYQCRACGATGHRGV